MLNLEPYLLILLIGGLCELLQTYPLYDVAYESAFTHTGQGRHCEPRGDGWSSRDKEELTS